MTTSKSKNKLPKIEIKSLEESLCRLVARIRCPECYQDVIVGYKYRDRILSNITCTLWKIKSIAKCRACKIPFEVHISKEVYDRWKDGVSIV